MIQRASAAMLEAACRHSRLRPNRAHIVSALSVNLSSGELRRIDPMTEALGRLVTTLDVIGLEAFVAGPPRGPGRRALARAFVAKAMLGVPTTNALIERLDVDKSARRILGWERRAQVPSEATFSRAFAEFAQGDLPDKMHAALIECSLRAHRRGDRTRRHRDRGAREAGQEGDERQGRRSATARRRSADAQARTPTQGRATAKTRADAARTAAPQPRSQSTNLSVS